MQTYGVLPGGDVAKQLLNWLRSANGAVGSIPVTVNSFATAPDTYQPPDLAAFGWPLFPSSYALYQPITGLPVHAQSATWLSAIDPLKTAVIHPNFGNSGYAGKAGRPYNVVGLGTPLIPCPLRYADASDAGPWPIQDGQILEFGDPHLHVLDKSLGLLYEIYNIGFDASGNLIASSGVAWDLTQLPTRPNGFTAASASGLPMLPFVVRYEEAASGVINHALEITVKPTQRAFVAPATHQSGKSTTPLGPPMGARLRWKGDPSTVVSPKVRAILVAAATYGFVISDNGSTGYLDGMIDVRWNDLELAELKQHPISTEFDIVDSGPLMS